MNKRTGPLSWWSTFINLFYPTYKAKGPIYDFKVKTLGGEEVSFEQFRGKKLLIVNTASKCCFTTQYKDLQHLHERYNDKVAVLGFPANNFMWQEPGSNDEIASFCEVNYGVTFPVFEKISVKGRSMHPLYQWLAAKSGKSPSWNFCKYLIDEKGEVIDFYSSKVLPTDPKIIHRIVS